MGKRQRDRNKKKTDSEKGTATPVDQGKKDGDEDAGTSGLEDGAYGGHSMSGSIEMSDEERKRIKEIGDFLKKKVLKNCLSKLVEHMKPAGLLDIFKKEALFNRRTAIQVRDISEMPNTSDRNRAIVTAIESRPPTYIVFKTALIRTKQPRLKELLEGEERSEHTKLTEKQECVCEDSGRCPVLQELVCPISNSEVDDQFEVDNKTDGPLEEQKKGTWVTQNIVGQNVQIGDKNVIIDKTCKTSYADKVREAAATDKSGYCQLNIPKNKSQNGATVMQKINAKNVTINMPQPDCTLGASSPLQKRSSDFEKLDNALKNYETNHYFFVAGQTQFQRDIGVLAHLPLIAVIDLDQHSRKKGLFCSMYDNLKKERSVHIKTWQDTCSLSLDSTHWVFMCGCVEHPDSLTLPEYDSWKDQVKKKLRSITNQLENVCDNVTVVVVWPDDAILTDHITFVLGKLNNALDDAKFIVVAKEKKRLPHFHGFDDIVVVELTINDLSLAMKTLISPNEGIVSSDYKLPTNEGIVSCLTVEEANLLKEDLEILFTENQSTRDLTSDDLRKEEDNFFKGGTLPWAYWYEMDSYLDAKRKIMPDMIQWIEKHLSVCKSACLRLHHDPGAGGTTLAQRIMWEFRNKMPCAQLKQKSKTSVSDTTDKLELLSSRTHLPILLLVDGEDEHRVETLQVKIQCCCIILYVKRCTEPSSNPKIGKFGLVKTLSSEEVKKVSLKYIDQCHRHNKTNKQIAVVKQFADDVIKHKADHCLFEFGLVVHTYEYRGIVSYVREFLQLGNIETQSLLAWQKALAYLALVYFYGQSSIPNSFLANILGIKGKVYLNTVYDFPKEMREFIVPETHTGKGLHTRICHYYIAKEILEQLLVFPNQNVSHPFSSELSSEARTRLHNLAINFIKEAEFVSSGRINTTVHDLLLSTIISRDNKVTGENETQANKSKRSKLSPILEDASSRPPYTERFLILKQLTESFPSEPQFLAHLGRLYTIYRTNEIETAAKYFRDALAMCCRQIEGVSDDEIPYHVRQALMHIHHMYGNMFVSKVAPYTGRYLGDMVSITPGRNPISEEATQILEDVRSACEHFSECREFSPRENMGSFGFIGEINIRLMFCDFVRTHCGANDFHQFIRASNTDVAKFVSDSYMELDDLFLNCFSIIEPDKLDSSMANCQEWFSAIFGDSNPGNVILNRDEESIYSRRMNVALIKMKYSKRKSIGVLEFVDDTNDIVFIVKEYEKNFQDLRMSTSLPCPKRVLDLDFREWLCAIRHKLFPEKYTLEHVFRFVELWNDKLNTPFARFYLFVFTSLFGFGTSRGSPNRSFLKKSESLKIEMLKYAKQMTKPRYPREWLGPYSHCMGRLIAGKRFFRDIDTSSSPDASYQIVVGTIRSPNNKPSGGKIDLDLGPTNTVAVEVFFVPAVANLVGKYNSGKRVEFELGFSMSKGYEAFEVKLLKTEKCPNCGKIIEIRSCDWIEGVMIKCDSCSSRIRKR